MQDKHYDNTLALLEYLTEGILIIESENRIIANKIFKEIFNLDHVQIPSIVEAFERYGLMEVLNSRAAAEKSILINNRKIKVTKLISEACEGSIPTIIVLKNDEKTEDTNSEINKLKQSLEAMRDILDIAYQGMVLVDKDGLIVKWNYEKLMGIKEKDVLGKPVDDVIENTRMHIVVKTGKSELYDVQRIQGHDMIANRIPIKKDGKIIGAVGTVLFKDVKEVKDLAKRLKMLESTVDKYKGEINKMYRAQYSFNDIITQNEKMLELKQISRKAAKSNSTILIQGESGTGKEYFAHAIHNESFRKDEPFIRINCAAIPQELLESELFGHEGGAFTGAKKEGKIGKFELADGGTILLDEISSMPYSMQAKLLRVLEEREFERIGGNTRINIDIRIIACTNENLQTAVKEGRFRQDLFYRLNVVEINIPPLRERLDDIPILSDDVLNQLVQKMGLSYKTVSEKAMLLLKSYNWPGNVRELRNVLERAANISSGSCISPEHLPDFINNRFYINNNKIKMLRNIVAEAEIKAIMEALRSSNGSRTDAARKLGIHRTALYKKLDSYGISITSM